MSNRDDFSEQVKQILRDRVGGYCSNPVCCVLTTGSHTDPNRRISIGIAAHITAAASGGPRYNPVLTPEQRSSADNGIWLCANCARLIDSDEAAYSEELLNDWKKQAEAKQNQRLLNPNYNGDGTNINSLVNIAEMNNCWSDTLKLWRILGENLERYQAAIDFAYENWSHNFKYKYPDINNEINRFYNSAVQELQDEIDKYEDTLYKTMLDDIYNDFKKSQRQLIGSFGYLKIEMSQQLENMFKSYFNCMTFHYESDGGIGLVNNYWSSFFITLDKNYERMKELKGQIDSLIRTEYSMIKQK